jgi:isocitrate dehydrogenase
MTDPKLITVAYGDGIGPEIMEATLKILAEFRANIKIETIEIGELQYKHGYPSGITPDAWETVTRNKILLKAPITTPQGKGYKSLNVTLRKSLGLYSNVRPVVTYHPFVPTATPGMDVVIVRENEEDLYAGMEYKMTDNFHISLKVITRPGSEKIMRYAFEYAVRNGRKKITCMSKDNIMKITDGLFHRVFDTVAKEYPQIEAEHYIIDIGSARLAAKPYIFDVIVTENLYGDIISDIAAEVSGSVGLAGSANIGDSFAMFEAVHGSAPDIAGKNIANPSGLLNAACMMLVHIGQPDVAAEIQNAWRATLEQGIHTGDVYNEATSKQKVGTKEFAEAVIANMLKKPVLLPPARYGERKDDIVIKNTMTSQAKRELIGVDVYIDRSGHEKDDPKILAELASSPEKNSLTLQSIVNRGLVIWPTEAPEATMGDIFRCRYIVREDANKGATQQDIIDLISTLNERGLDISITYRLYTFDGEYGFSLGQGE